MTDLSTLLSRVESGSGADRQLDAAIWSALTGHACHQGPDETWLAPRGESGLLHAEVACLTTDLNAVVALVEARLPGWGWDITYRAAWGTSAAHVIGPTREAKPYVATAPTPARALLAALIRAEMEKVK